MTKTIKYKGKEYHLRISYKALKGVVLDLGREFDGGSETFDFEGAETLMYHAMKSGQEYHNLPFDLTKEQMADVLDEVGISQFVDAFTAFTQPPTPTTRGQRRKSSR
jgi:hypothetical protein